MAAEDEEEGPTERRYCTLGTVTIRRLKALAKRGTHGPSVPKIMTAFIEQGVREAIEKNYLKIEDGE